MRALLVLLLVVAAGAVAWVFLAAEPAPERTGRGTAEAPAQDGSAPPAPPAEAEPQPERFVAGRLVNEEGAPVAGATVRVRVWENGLRDFGTAVRSGAGGRFRVGVPVSGHVGLRIWHPEYQLVDHYPDLTATEPLEIVLRRGVPVTVLVRTPEGEAVAGCAVQPWSEHRTEEGWTWLTELDKCVTDAEGRAFLGALARGAVRVRVDDPRFAVAERSFDVTGPEACEFTVTLDVGGAVEGTVTAPGGAPVAGARVHPIGDEVRVAVTDESGRYRLSALKSGVHLMAEAEGWGPGVFGDALGWGRSVPIPIAPGETVPGIDIRLDRPAWVQGRLADERGAPLADLILRVDAQPAVPGFCTARTDRSGAFRAGPFTVRRDRARVQVALLSPERRLDPPDELALSPAGELDVGELVARPRGRVRGRVLDVDGTPLVRGRVWAAGFSAMVAPDGTFELAGVAGAVRLHAAAAGNPPRAARPVLVTVADGATVEGVELRLEETLELKGRVITPDGKPRADVDVIAVKPGSEPPFEWGDESLLGHDKTGAKGEFRITGLFPGELVVMLADWQNGKLVPVPDVEPVPATAGGPPLEIYLPLEGGIVRGRVVSAATGRPVPEFHVAFLRYTFVIPQFRDSQDFEDADGRFQHELAEPGTWAVEVRAKGFARKRTKTVKVAKGDVVDLGEIRLGAAGSIHGVVRDHAGRPVDFARIHILNALIQTNWIAPYTDRAGAYEIPGVSPGRYNLFVVSPRHPLAVVRDVVVGEGEKVRVDVRLQPSAPLTIRVVDEAARPVPGAKLIWTFDAIKPLNSSMASGYEPPGYGANVSDQEGIIRKPYLAAGPVDLRIEAEGFLPAARTVELEPGQPKEIVLRLERK